MKIRTTHNSIRLRIRKSELDILHKEESISESLTFVNGISLRTVLFINHKISTPEASFRETTISVGLPPELAKQWIESDQVGIEQSLNINNGESLHLLIEKDFPCLDRPNEDKSDTFWELAADKDANSC